MNKNQASAKEGAAGEFSSSAAAAVATVAGTESMQQPWAGTPEGVKALEAQLDAIVAHRESESAPAHVAASVAAAAEVQPAGKEQASAAVEAELTDLIDRYLSGRRAYKPEPERKRERSITPDLEEWFGLPDEEADSDTERAWRENAKRIARAAKEAEGESH